MLRFGGQANSRSAVSQWEGWQERTALLIQTDGLSRLPVGVCESVCMWAALSLT